MLFFLMGPPGAEGGGATGGDVLLLFAITFMIFWFIVVRPQRRQENERRDMLGNLKKNDQVITQGGIIGKVVSIKDNRVIVKVEESSNTKVTFLRSAIIDIIKQEKKDSKDSGKK